MANNTTLAGHVHVGDWVIFGGFSGAHQFCKIGPHAFLGMYAAVSRDVPAYTMIAGSPALPRGINSEGLKRRGFTAEQIRNIKNAYRIVYGKAGNWPKRWTKSRHWRHAAGTRTIAGIVAQFRARTDSLMRVGLVAGEASGDLLGAGLIEAIRDSIPDATFEGVAGPAMVCGGLREWEHAEALAVMGLIEPLTEIPRLLQLAQVSDSTLARVIHRMCSSASMRRISISVWKKRYASRSSRLCITSARRYGPGVPGASRLYKKAADTRACAFCRSRKALYDEQGIDAVFVGHPKAEPPPAIRCRVMRGRDAGSGRRVVAVLPGSGAVRSRRLGSDIRRGSRDALPGPR